MKYFIGIDVGTQSVRSSLINETGQTECHATRPLTVRNPHPDHYEQSCSEIWDGITRTITELRLQVGPDTWSRVRGVGCDATCSLVVCDREGTPLSLSRDGGADGTVLMWMDHRAEGQADRINNPSLLSPSSSSLKGEGPHEVLRFVGGAFSPEQQPPKLLWVKEHLPQVWDRAVHFFDLPDWLTYKLTGRPIRSQCSVTCKWGYVRHRGGWDLSFFAGVGLGDLTVGQLGPDVRLPGSVAGVLERGVADELELGHDVRVGVSLIDAHAGALAMLRYGPGATSVSTSSMGIISGTSTCIMGLDPEMRFVRGVWGPYQDVVVEGVWLYEGGQTAAGSALDHVVRNHPSYTSDVSYETLNTDLGIRYPVPYDLHTVTRHLHVQPDLHGNRSPLALPWIRGVMYGLDLSCGHDNLLHVYLATLQGLCFCIRMIVEALSKEEITFDKIVLCGGLARNSLYASILATVARLPVVVPDDDNLMCVGSAMLAQAASEEVPLMEVVHRQQSEPMKSETSYPIEELIGYYDAKYEVYREICNSQLKFRSKMNNCD